MSSIRDPIQERFAEPRIRKHRRPLGKRQVGGDDDGCPLGPLRDHLEEELRADVGRGHVSDLVERDQFVLLPARHQLANLVVLLGFDQLVDQRRRRGEANTPLLPTSSQAQAGGKVSLSGAALADQYNRFLAFDVAAFGQFANTGRRDLRCLRKIELFERLHARQLRISNAVIDGVPVAFFALDGQ